MRARMLIAFVTSLWLAGGAAHGDTPEAGTKVGGGSPYTAKLSKGHQAYASRDYQGAIAAYKDAIAENGNDALAYYFLGEAQIAVGSLPEADSSFAKGLSLVGGKDDLHAKLLFVTADLFEREGKWPEAKKGWDDYAQFLAAQKLAKGYPATATERNKVVDVHVDLEAKYAEVKQRIEQRVKETTAPPPDDGPQGPAKKK